MILPTREVAGHAPARARRDRALDGLVDEMLVVDADSRDGTAEVARERGVRGSSPRSRPHGPRWARATRCGAASPRPPVSSSASSTPTPRTSPTLRARPARPAADRADVDFVKGHFRRPLRVGDTTHPEGGGRVTELLARPYLNLHFPELAGFRQPLAGEVAATRELLERLPFPVGYGIEIAMLIDAQRAVGLERMAQVDLGTRQNRHQPLRRALAGWRSRCSPRPSAAPTATTAPGPLLVPTHDDFEVRAALTDERPPLATRP